MASKLHHWVKSYGGFAEGWIMPIGGVASDSPLIFFRVLHFRKEKEKLDEVASLIADPSR